MWLINVENGLLEEFIGARIPPYAILSHTWEDGQEVTFQEVNDHQANKGKRGYQKIKMTCRLAAEDGLQYVWVDTCCIDKSSSAELTEAINSMYNWYKRSAQCYAYLSDLSSVPTVPLEGGSWAVEHCRWFRRGWTLQELIAPTEIKFYNQDWRLCFKRSDASDQLAQITGVESEILNHTKELSMVSVAQKMSWAASRQSTRIEDTAYCLLGIFEINMPLLYGEEERAFTRLQAEIIKSCPDPSIFAWTHLEAGRTAKLFSGVLAPSPESFSSCRKMIKLRGYPIPDFSTSNRGIKIRAKFGLGLFPGKSGIGLMLPVGSLDGTHLCIQLRNMGDGCFARQNPAELLDAQSAYLEPRLSRITLEPFLLTHITTWSLTQERQWISASHHRCMKLQLAPDMEIYNRWPWLNWDEVDRVFFAPEDSDVGWAALKIVCSPPPLRGYVIHESFDFLFYVFGWDGEVGPEKPHCGVHRVFGRLADRHLEDLNDRAVVEKWDAYWVANRLRMNGTPEHSAIIGPSAGGYTMILTFTIDIADDERVCVNPFWSVKFYWRVVPNADVVRPADLHWRNVVAFVRR